MKLPQFSLRDLFWLMLVCALACAWWVERARLMTEQQWKGRFEALQEAIESAGYSVTSSDGSVSIKKSYGDHKLLYSGRILRTP